MLIVPSIKTATTWAECPRCLCQHSVIVSQTIMRKKATEILWLVCPICLERKEGPRAALPDL